MAFFIELFLFITAGLIAGSFASAIAHREEKNFPWWSSDEQVRRSACQSCGHALSHRDLIPLISWISLKGKCRYCRAAIAKSYPLLELGCASAAALVYLTQGISLTAIFSMVALPFLMALFLIDFRTFLLPNRLVAILGAIGFVRIVTEGFVFQTIEPAIIGGNYILAVFIYGGLAWGMKILAESFLKKEALGMGDVKFFAVSGLWLGLTKLPDFCIVAGVLGVAFALIWRYIKKEDIFPFGPALIVSFFILLMLDGSLLV